jgi:pyruvate,water dikinase
LLASIKAILVAQATSPIWTTLLGIAAAAVTEVGGPFAHAAIVAQEFGTGRPMRHA